MRPFTVETRRTSNADDMALRALRFFLDASHPESGLTLDRTKNMLGSAGQTRIASIAATGYAVTAFCIGVHYGWLDRRTATQRIERVLTTVETKLSGKAGFYYHFIDWETGAREWNSELSSIDTALLQLGLIMAANVFGGDIAKRVNAILAKTDWQWMQNRSAVDPADVCVSMGWKPESGFLDSRWDHYDESPYLYILALGAQSPHRLPASTWKNWKTTPDPKTGLYEPIGPIFWSQMTAGYVNLKGQRDSAGRDLWMIWQRSHAHHIRFCKEQSGRYKTYRDGVFGINACDQPPPVGYGAQEAVDGRHDGTIAPTAILAARMFDRAAADKALTSLHAHVGKQAYGPYGFPNALNEDKNWIDPDVLGLDLGMAICGYANARDGYIWKTFTKHTVVQAGLRAMGYSGK
jgi:hypothetical protein